MHFFFFSEHPTHLVHSSTTCQPFVPPTPPLHRRGGFRRHCIFFFFNQPSPLFRCDVHCACTVEGPLHCHCIVEESLHLLLLLRATITNVHCTVPFSPPAPHHRGGCSNAATATIAFVQSRSFICLFLRLGCFWIRLDLILCIVCVFLYFRSYMQVWVLWEVSVCWVCVLWVIVLVRCECWVVGAVRWECIWVIHASCKDVVGKERIVCHISGWFSVWLLWKNERRVLWGMWTWMWELWVHEWCIKVSEVRVLYRLLKVSGVYGAGSVRVCDCERRGVCDGWVTWMRKTESVVCVNEKKRVV